MLFFRGVRVDKLKFMKRRQQLALNSDGRQE